MKASRQDQQPIARTVGRRMSPPVGTPPTAEARAAWTAMAGYQTRAPKGVFIYSSHEEMSRERERWAAEALANRALLRA